MKKKTNSFCRIILCIICFVLHPAFIFAQNNDITGIVTDAQTKEPLIGVSVVQKGTTNGTITDIDGKFSLSAPTGSTVAFNYLGYKGFETTATSNKLNAELKEDSEFLDEVVVIGYGIQKKSVVTAAISRISSEELNTTKPSRIEDALKGKVSGVQITQSSGQPGASSKVRIRGVGTVNNSDPLYIVDGMAVDGGINYLNPADIQSIEILKDAASAAVYGTRGANGVILVTTKSGEGAKGGKAIVSYDVSYGWQNPWKKRSVLNATEYMTLMNEAAINDGNKPRYTQEQIGSAGKGTDWQNETFNYDAPVQSHQISVAGNKETVSYFLSFGYFNQEGIIGGDYGKSNYERYSFRANTTATVFEEKSRSFLNKLRVGVNSGYSRAVSSGIEVNSEYGSVLGSALAFAPTIPVYATDPDATLAQYPNAVTDKNGNVYSTPPAGFQEIANPVGMLNSPTNATLNEDKFVATFWGEMDVVEGLKFKSTYGADLAFWGNDGYTFPYFLATQGKNIKTSSVYSDMHRGYTWQVENTLNYNKTLGKHNFTLLLGQSAKKHTLRELRGDDYDLLEYLPEKANINYSIADRNEERTTGGTGGYTAETLASYFGRLSYDYDEKYMLQLTVRRDGSSRFGANNKWATFPSISLGWNLTSEEFMKSRPEWFDYMKLRFSWGKNGNENIGNFKYTSLMEKDRNYYFGSKDYSTMHFGSSAANLANPNIKWEQSQQTDIGFEARFLNSALTFGFDYFHKKTIGMLMDQPIPSYVGRAAPVANAGDMNNSGVEMEAAYSFKIKDASFKVAANASYLKNELIKLGNESGENIYADAGAAGIGSYIKGQNGEVFPFFYGYKTGGILQNQAEADAYNTKYEQKAVPGDVIFQDLAGALDGNGNAIGDGKITDADKVKIGKGMPDWTFGLTLNAEWRSFDMSVFFQSTMGNDIYDFSQRGDITAMNRPSWTLDRWIGEGTSNKIPRMTAENPNRNWRSSDLYVKDGSYIRLKTLQIGYTLPAALTKKVSVQHLRLFVNAENLLTFTKYDGFDPEIAAGDDYFNIGVDKGIYPQSRTISVGANISF